MRVLSHILAAMLVSLALAGCGPNDPSVQTITLATTTSPRDTGLLDDLLPRFEKSDGIQVRVVAVGTGQALEIARRGDADVVLVHAREFERQFVEEGFGIERRPVMKNEFVIIGPADDPAGVRQETSAATALKRLADSQATFVSRGDQSGTHVKEQSLWKAAGIEPQGDWYVSAGQGQAATIRMADEKRGYNLTDRGTYLSLRDQIDLEVVLEGDPALENLYSVIVVNPAMHPHVQHDAAERFADFLQSPAGREAIANFGAEKFGQPLFIPIPAE